MARQEGVMFPGNLKQTLRKHKAGETMLKKINEYKEISDIINIWAANKVCS